MVFFVDQLVDKGRVQPLVVLQKFVMDVRQLVRCHNCSFLVQSFVPVPFGPGHLHVGKQKVCGWANKKGRSQKAGVETYLPEGIEKMERAGGGESGTGSKQG
jgi:hypothetical protein